MRGETGPTLSAMTRLDRLTRKRDRGSDERAALDALLDEVLVGTLATVVDGEPWVVPMLFARDGDRVLLHGSTGAGALRHVAAGAPVALEVHSVDGLVLAHATFDHSANYRSAVIRGRVVELGGDEAAAALETLSDRLVPGRTAEVRGMLDKEIAATRTMALPIIEGSWILKSRAGGPGGTEESHDAWRGVVPLVRAYGVPEPAGDSVDRPLPASVRRLLESD